MPGGPVEVTGYVGAYGDGAYNGVDIGTVDGNGSGVGFSKAAPLVGFLHDDGSGGVLEPLDVYVVEVVGDQGTLANLPGVGAGGFVIGEQVVFCAGGAGV